MTERETSGWAVGWATFAALMMIMIGFWHAIAGLVALFENEFYVVGTQYVFQFDVTTWGWVHLILGVLVILAGVAIFSGAVWARTIGVILAVVSAVAAFAWLPYYPIWGGLIAASAIFVIWALTAHGRDIVKGV